MSPLEEAELTNMSVEEATLSLSLSDGESISSLLTSWTKDCRWLGFGLVWLRPRIADLMSLVRLFHAARSSCESYFH